MSFYYRSIFRLFFFTIISFQAIAQESYIAKGTVIDYETKQPIKQVSVVVQSLRTGTTTNDSGYFSIPIKSSKVIIQFTYIGYTSINKEYIFLATTKPFLIELKREATPSLDDVTVKAFKERSKLKTTEMNVVRINPESIKQGPILLGEADIIKALILQPGITSTGESAGGFNVRGGNADENLVLVDGAPLFNTSHLLGFYTSLSPDVVQDISLYKGGMPAEYGGRLSSLLTMKIKNGNKEEIQYNGGVGPMSSRFFVNGPLIKNKLTFTSGFRTAYPNFILNQLGSNFGNSRASFYDAVLKAEYTINDKNTLSITGYRSFDKFKFDSTMEYQWESNLVSLNFNSELNSKLTFKFNANRSNFFSTIFGLDKAYEYSLISKIDQTQLKPTFVYHPAENHTIETGLDYILYQVSPGAQKPNSVSSNIIPITIPKEQGREMAAFISDNIEVNSKLSIQLGLRYVGYDYLGPKNVYQYEQGYPMSKETISDTIRYAANKIINSEQGFEPRIAIKYSLSDVLSLKISYNRGQQFLHLISNTTSISPVDFWKLSDPYIKKQIGDQYATGLFSSFVNNLYEASVVVYYKTTQNTVQYKDGGTLLLNPYIESALLNARGRAYGVEMSVAKNFGKVTGQVNYTYSQTQVKVLNTFPSEIVNKGAYYFADIDKPHNLAIIAKIKLQRGWTFNTNFIFTSGRPATFPDGNYLFNQNVVSNYSLRNSDRLPAYHRIDAGWSYSTKISPEQKKYSTWNISFYNLYMHENAYSVYFKNVNTRLRAYQLSIIGSIIPSITWNYNF